MTDPADSARGASLTAWPPNRNRTVTSISTEPTRAIAVDRKAALPLEGDIVGESYRLVLRLGEGMFGCVYVAERTDVPEHKVALKVISRAMYAGRNVERELVMLAAASHPHVVQLKDHGVTDDYIWLTMPLYEGETLAERLERGPLSPRQAHDIFLPIARGLASLHGRGMRHQDVKPENIYLARFADQIHPVLLDLGVAVEHDSPFVAGTVLYCSPEQVTALGGIAGAAQLSPKMDTYCLATTLLRSLTSEEEYDREPADTPLKMANHFEQREKDPLGDSLMAMAPSAREKLREAFQGWFQRDPELRPDTATMAAELDVLLEEERLAAAAIEEAILAQKTSLRRVRVALAALALTGVAAGLVGYSKRKTLQLATALQKAKAAGAASFDKLDTCIAAHKLTQVEHDRCKQNRVSDQRASKRNLDIIVTANNLERRTLTTRYDGARANLRACEDLGRKNQQNFDRERSNFETQRTGFQRSELAWQSERTQLQSKQKQLETTLAQKTDAWSQERRKLADSRDQAQTKLQTAATRIATLANENTQYQTKLTRCTKARNTCMVEAARQHRSPKTAPKAPPRSKESTTATKATQTKKKPVKKQPSTPSPSTPSGTKASGKAGPNR